MVKTGRWIVCPCCCMNRKLNEYFHNGHSFSSFDFEDGIFLQIRQIIGGRNPDGSYTGHGFPMDRQNSMTLKKALNDSEAKAAMDEIFEFCNKYIAYYKKINKEK